MKRFLLLTLAIVPGVTVAEDSVQTRLAGILKVEGWQVAILEDPSFRQAVGGQLAQREGQKDGKFEMVRIQAENGLVQLRLGGEKELHTLKLQAAGCLTNQAADGLVLEGASLRTVLNFLGEFSERTILAHPSLPEVKFSVSRQVTNRAEAAQILTAALLEKQILTVLDGEKFLLVGPKAKLPTLIPRSNHAQPSATAVETELIPRGSIVFTAATIPQVSMICAEFLGSKLDRESPIPPASGTDGRIFLIMQNALTKVECSYALETVLGWHGIKLVPSGTGLVKAVPTE